MLDKVISYAFYLLFLLAPLFWTPINHELFEYNKMMLTYGLTVVVAGSWILKMINRKAVIFQRTPLDIPLLLFLGANILSTIFSIDPHTSFWGYYSRLNGGLLSTVSYLLLYWAFVSNMNFNHAQNLLKFGLFSGFLISLWGISEHFGVSPSCIILKRELNNFCWIQNVQTRVFATLGQPNWLAAYLAMLIFPALYFFLTATNKLSRSIYYLLLTAYYLTFTFTYSRGPTLGLIGGMLAFLVYLLLRPGGVKTHLGGVITILASFLLINLLFGSAFTSFRLVSKFAAPARPGIALPAASGTQLENGGTESGQIRFIVWKGALDIFKHYPIFGSGLETFAYSYYQYRPVAHNLTSEWDFLYNKAHNEYLNYLATTGIAGFGIYVILILTFIIWCLKIENSERTNFSINLLVIALLASYISYLIYNFFLFSVVIIAIFFFLFPALAFVAAGSTKSAALSKKTVPYPLSLITLVYSRPFYVHAAKGIVLFAVCYLLFAVFKLWYADTLFNKGEAAAEAGNPAKAYNFFSAASELNQGEPLYRSELGLAAAQVAAALEDSDATLSAVLKEEAKQQTAKVLTENPDNISYYRTAVRTYFELAAIDETYLAKTIKMLDLAIKLAPTDPKLYYNKALILDLADQKEEKIKALQQAVGLKPNYLEAITQLAKATASKEASKE